MAKKPFEKSKRDKDGGKLPEGSKAEIAKDRKQKSKASGKSAKGK
jgi:hypothetical protein